MSDMFFVRLKYVLGCFLYIFCYVYKLHNILTCTWYYVTYDTFCITIILLCNDTMLKFKI
jgi:hypothetical protein